MIIAVILFVLAGMVAIRGRQELGRCLVVLFLIIILFSIAGAGLNTGTLKGIHSNLHRENVEMMRQQWGQP